MYCKAPQVLKTRVRPSAWFGNLHQSSLPVPSPHLTQHPLGQKHWKDPINAALRGSIIAGESVTAALLRHSSGQHCLCLNSSLHRETPLQKMAFLALESSVTFETSSLLVTAPPDVGEAQHKVLTTHRVVTPPH